MVQTDVLTMAMVGCGNIARAHWRGIRNRASRIRVTAVVDSDPDNAASMSEQTGAVAYSSLSEALASWLRPKTFESPGRLEKSSLSADGMGA